MVLYSKFTYGSQLSGEKKTFENPMLGCRDICKINTAPFFLNTLYSKVTFSLYENANELEHKMFHSP